MRAVLIEAFGVAPTVQTVPDPTPVDDGVVIQVRANGICRSDWHGWMGHDSDISLPHVPGHELAGEVVAVGRSVTKFRPGDRVTVPFSVGCGDCSQCRVGNHHICDDYFQPGFTHWGSFAELVGIHHADANLVALPDELDFVTAASLGCRFATAFRGVVTQARIQGGQFLAVHGCGGVGLSSIMIAAALGVRVIAVDIDDAKLELARSCGAAVAVNAREQSDVPAMIRDVTGGGAHASIDALGSRQTCVNSVNCLRKRGRHVQIGLMLADDATPSIPMGPVIGRELEIVGSHGMQGHAYGPMLEMITSGYVDISRMVGKRVTLDESADELARMDQFNGVGVSVIVFD